jgi:general secretion pathway protein L
MPERIIGLDINADAVSAVQLTSRVKGYEVTACGRVAIEEAGGLEAGLKALAEQMASGADTWVTTLPGEQVSYRNLRMPFKDNKKIKQTLAYELETIVPFPVEDLIVDFTMIEEAEQSEILAAAVSRARISEYLSRLAANGIDPEVLDISGVPTVSWLLRQHDSPDDGLFLAMGRTHCTMILYVKRRIALIRTFSFDGRVLTATDSGGTTSDDGSVETGTQIESSLRAFCAEVSNTLHAFSCRMPSAVPERIFLTGSGTMHPDVETRLSEFFALPVERLDLAKDPRIEMSETVTAGWNPALMDNALAVAMRDGKQGLGFNFRRDEFETKKQYLRHKGEIWKAAVFLIIILCFLGANLGVDYYSLKKQSAQLDQRIEEVFRQTFPDVKRIVDPVQQMRVKIEQVKKSALSLPGGASQGTVLDLLKDISQRVPESADVDVARVVVDPDAVLIKGQTDTFNTVDAVKKALEPSTYFDAVTISSANLDRSSNRVEFEMKLQRHRS